MVSNTTYNLMESASVISKGLHRYDTFKSDAKGCQHCLGIWDEMKQTDEKLLQRMVGHLREHLDRERDAKAA